MGADTKIEWCDHTFNPWIGCAKVSPGCANCYAATQDAYRKWTPEGWGAGKPRRRTSAANWREPLKWDAARAGVLRDVEACATPDHGPRPRVFCASLADWLDDEVPVEWLAALFDLIRCTPHLDWLMLTKRPQLWRERLSAVVAMEVAAGPSGVDQCYGIALAAAWLNGNPPANVWLGTTVEDQQRAEERTPLLLRIPARVRFLSGEPLLEPVDLGRWLMLERITPIKIDDGRIVPTGPTTIHKREPSEIFPDEEVGIHWVICGGESGPGARPMHPDWARALRDQCAAAGVAYFFKQWGDWLPGCQYFPGTRVRERAQHTFDADNHSFLVGKKDAGRLLDGVEHNAFPHPNP